MSTRIVVVAVEMKYFVVIKMITISSKVRILKQKDLLICLCVCVWGGVVVFMCESIHTPMRAHPCVCLQRPEEGADSPPLSLFAHFFEAESFPEPGPLVFPPARLEGSKPQQSSCICFLWG